MSEDLLGLSSEPRLRILELLKRSGPTTVDALVDLVGLSKTAVRSHLVKLEDAELIQRVDAPTQSPGRPPLSYAITKRGGRVFPQDDGDLFTEFLSFVSERDEPMVREFFAELWAQRSDEFDSALGERGADNLGARRLTLEDLLERTNFMPEVVQRTTDTGTEVIVRECNCPFPAAVRATRIPCELERSFLERALGGTCVAARLARDRADVCTFRIAVD